MEESEHVFLSGSGAEDFAVSKGFKLIDNSNFITNNRLNSLKNIKKESLMLITNLEQLGVLL